MKDRDAAASVTGHEAAFEWQRDVPVGNTLHLPATARCALVLHETGRPLFERQAIADWLVDRETLVVGGGSNLVFVTSTISQSVRVDAAGWWVDGEGDRSVDIVVEAGKGLDALVRETARRGWFGLEALAEIPGSVGAAPVQNVGAYGTEIGEHVRWVEVFDRDERGVARLTARECQFGYRQSRFKREPARWLILRVGLRLHTQPPEYWPDSRYPGVAQALAEWSDRSGRPITAIGPDSFADLITTMRRRKLPDWRQGLPGSVGSFFQNPVISMDEADRLTRRWPDLPRFPVSGSAGWVKLSAGWLIEQVGWKGYRDDGVGVSPNHALVLMHYGGADGQMFWSLARRIRGSVERTFGVALEPEPRIIE